MLTESSYLTALYVYVAAAIMALLCLAWWLRRWPAGLVALLVLLGAAVLLTPAYPREGVTTLAPAVIVAGFQIFTEGVESAEYALKPLATVSAAAVVLALLLRITVFRRRAKDEPREEAGES